MHGENHEANHPPSSSSAELVADVRRWANELGFQQVGITDVDLRDAEEKLLQWLAAGHHGEMDYMARHGHKRSRPQLLTPGTLSVISVRMDYLPEDSNAAISLLDHDSKAYVARYALGRDYHKLMRRKLGALGKKIEQQIGAFGYRVFTDSAPVLEKPLAEKAGLGWIGKHTNLLNKNAGSWFFLGEIYTDLKLPADKPATSHCGSCHACIDVCPTKAIVAPYQLDARRCISYLTIELKESIPPEYRDAIGNRVFGCDDCQLFCPWNKFASLTTNDDFMPRHGLDSAELVDLFNWSEEEWQRKTEGSAIRRIGFERWLRNIAVALGNAAYDENIVAALERRSDSSSALVNEHVCWALDKQRARQPNRAPKH